MEKGRLNVGVIGCGTISEVYLNNLTKHCDNLQVTACADIIHEKAVQASQKYNIPKACSVDELLADKDIDLVVNLTIPAAHYEVNMKCLRAGKHVYCEKPFALTLEEADEIVDLAAKKGLLAASAPDTFLGAGIQTSRKLIDDGALGNIVGFTANMTSPGVDLWHPAPDFYYKKGAGPMWDMGPYYLTALVTLLGPIKKVFCFASSARTKRTMYDGREVTVEVPTHYVGIIEFACGTVGNINMSFDVWHSNLPVIELFGSKGSMGVPDPNMFNGAVTLCDGTKVEEVVKAVGGGHRDRLIKLIQSTQELNVEMPYAFPAESQPRSNMRGLGVSEMASAIMNGRKCRLSGEMSRHVVEALAAFDASLRDNQPYIMKTTCQRPDPMPSNLPLWKVD